MTGKNYREWVKEELSRLKEFLSSALKQETGEFASVLQDGGEIRDRILEEAGPEIWEDFQTHFIDMAR